MKKLYLLLLIILGVNLHSQVKIWKYEEEVSDELVSPKVQEEIENYAFEIRKIVSDSKIKMDEEISEVNRDLENSKITLEQADSLKNEISIRYSNQIDEEISKLDFDLDKIIKEQVEFSILNTDLNVVVEEKGIKSKIREYKSVNQLNIYISYSEIYMPDGENTLLNNYFGYSNGFDIGFIKHRQLSSSSPFELINGLYGSFRTLRFNNNYFINLANDGKYTLIESAENLRKSKLGTAYLVFPIGLKYRYAPLEITASGDKFRNLRNSSFGISANLYFGFGLGSVRNIKTADSKTKSRGNFGVNRFVFGGQLTATLYGLNFYVRQDFLAYFRDGNFDNRKMVQFGIGIGF